MINNLTNTFNIIINDVSYNINMSKSMFSDDGINSIEIKFKNMRTKEVYHTILYCDNITLITINLPSNLDNFYNFLLSTFSQKNDKININCIEIDDKLSVNLFFTIEFLNKKINYEMILCKIERTDTEKFQEILLDINNILIINKEMINDLKDEINKLKQNMQHEIIDFRNKINECGKKNKKWNYIDPNNSNYNFGCGFKFSMYFNEDKFSHIYKEQNGVSFGFYDQRNENELCCHTCKESLRCELCQNINNIISCDANKHELKIAIVPNILQQSNKIKIHIKAMHYRNNNIIKLYANKNNPQYLICENIRGKIYPSTSSYKTFEITPSDTHICISNIVSDMKIVVNLEAYKN